VGSDNLLRLDPYLNQHPASPAFWDNMPMAQNQLKNQYSQAQWSTMIRDPRSNRNQTTINFRVWLEAKGHL